MTSGKDSVVESNPDSHIDFDLEKQMVNLNLDTPNGDEAREASALPRFETPGAGALGSQSELNFELSGAPPEGKSLERGVASDDRSVDELQSLCSTETPESLEPPPPQLEVHFEDIESKVVEYLARADGVKICAAWFTSTKIAEQLSLMGDVGLIIGSTDKITPGNPEYRANWVHTLLRDLPEMVFVYGGASGKRMMHNKFMVLFREGLAYAVITGSYNYTYSATENWENIVYIESKELGQKYFAEYLRIRQYCHPLNRYVRS